MCLAAAVITPQAESAWRSNEEVVVRQRLGARIENLYLARTHGGRQSVMRLSPRDDTRGVVRRGLTAHDDAMTITNLWPLENDARP